MSDRKDKGRATTALYINTLTAITKVLNVVAKATECGGCGLPVPPLLEIITEYCIGQGKSLPRVFVAQQSNSLFL